MVSVCGGDGREHTLSVETVRHAPYELAVRLARSSLDLFPSGIRVTVRDVRRDRAREEDRVLRDDADGVPPRRGRELSNIYDLGKYGSLLAREQGEVPWPSKVTLPRTGS